MTRPIPLRWRVRNELPSPPLQPFGGYEDNGGFPNFFGTSAAAPHAAWVAALLLQKAGGPNTLSSNQIRNILQASPVGPHDLSPFFSQAVAGGTGKTGAVTVTARGDGSNASSADPNFFRITFNGSGSVSSVTIDLTGAGLKFDTSATGFPLTFGQISNVDPAAITTNAPANNPSFRSLTLSFAPGAFRNGSVVSFGVDRDVFGDGGGNSADQLAGATITAVFAGAQNTGTFANVNSFGYSILDGYGLIDAVNAASQVAPPGSGGGTKKGK